MFRSIARTDSRIHRQPSRRRCMVGMHGWHTPMLQRLIGFQGHLLKITSVKRFGQETLIARLRRAPLRGFGGVLIYADCDLRLVPAMDPAALTPAQRYVLRPTLRRVVEVRSALLAEDVDTFALDGGAYFATSDEPSEQIPVIPPIIEESHESGGNAVLLINDGIHRIYAARQAGLPISVVLATNVPRKYPYYAYPLEAGWSQVSELDELPDEYEKKSYRQPDNYRALFRDFNAVFPGVQKQRKQSNPRHLTAG